MTSYSNNNNSRNGNDFRRRYTKLVKMESERDLNKRHTLLVKVENITDNLPAPPIPNTPERRISEMRNNPSIIDNICFRMRENIITHQQRMVIESRRKYNLSVNAGKESHIEGLKLEKELQDAESELKLEEKRMEIRALELDRDKVKLLREMEDPAVSTQEKELRQIRASLEFKRHKSEINLNFELQEYRERIKKGFHKKNTRTETLEEIRIARYAEVLKDTPLSRASARQLEQIRQIDEDLESYGMRLDDEDNE